MEAMAIAPGPTRLLPLAKRKDLRKHLRKHPPVQQRRHQRGNDIHWRRSMGLLPAVEN